MEYGQIYPSYVLIMDYLLGVVMWTLVGRGALDTFIAPDSQMVIAKVFRQVTNPVIHLFACLTPSFLVAAMVPLYVAWWFFMLRFYVLPLLVDGAVIGVLSFPLESSVGQLFRI